VEGLVHAILDLSHFGRYSFQTHSFIFYFCFLRKSLFLKGRRKKNLFGLYLGEGFENRPFKNFDPFPWATGLRLRSQIWKGLFSDPSPI
jgi:hypothetical protein